MDNNASRTARKKEFVKTFDRLTGAYHRWQVWQDMIVLFATAISNAADKRFIEKREAIYMETIQRYDKDKQGIFPELFGMLIQIMDESVKLGSYGDFLGELFMELGLGNELGGQFFTPYNVCVLMSRVSYDDRAKQSIEKRGYFACNDCACGAGATLIAMAQVLSEHKWNYQRCCMFVGQDIDYVTALMCYIQLSLLGCAGYVHVGNTLTDPMTGHVLIGDRGEDTWYTPMYFADVWRDRIQWFALRHALGLPEDSRLFTSDTQNESQIDTQNDIQNEPQSKNDKCVAVQAQEPESEIATIEIRGKKRKHKPEGQLMFDL